MAEIDTSAEPWLWWDTCQLVEDYVKVTLADQAANPSLFDKIQTEDQIRESCYNNPEFDRPAWDQLDGDLTEWMGDDTLWEAHVENFGWQKLSGQLKDVRATTGADLLHEVLPNTDCTFKIWKSADGEPKKLRIQNWHHDSPTGNEWYALRQI